MAALLALLLCAAAGAAAAHPPGSVKPNVTSTCAVDIARLVRGEKPWGGERQSLMLASMGLGVGDLGDYLTCDEVDGAVYAWVGETPSSGLGLCVPDSCDDGSLPPALELLASQIPCINDTVGPNSTRTASHVIGGGASLREDGAAVAVAVCLALWVAAVLGVTAADVRRRWSRESEDGGGAPDGDDDYMFRDDLDADAPLIGSGAVGSDSLGTPVAGGRRASRESAPWAERHFSLASTLSDLFSFSPRGERAGRFAVLNGLRVMSALWAVMGHTFLLAYGPLLKNRTYVDQFLVRRFTFQVVVSAALASDTFLVLSAFLGADKLLRQLRGGAPSAGRAQWLPVSYAYRLARLFPALFAAFLVYYRLSVHWGSGPLWNQYEGGVNRTCGRHSAPTLLFVQNFNPPDVADACMPWTYYLAVDFQLFILLPLVVAAYHRWPRSAAVVVGVMAVASVATAASVAAVRDLSPNALNVASYDRFTNSILTKPWSRASSYLIGVLALFAYDARRPQTHPPRSDILQRSTQVLGLMAAFMCLFISVFGAFHDYSDGKAVWTTENNVIYIALARPAFCLGVVFIVLLSLLGRGGVIEPLLSSPFWLPLSRLAYGMFLVHPMVIGAVYLSSGQLLYYRDITIFYYVISHTLLSVALAVFLYAFVERPFHTIAREVFARWRRPPSAAGQSMSTKAAYGST